MSNLCNNPNPPNISPCTSDFLVCLAQKIYESIRRIESNMKEFDKNFVDSLLEGFKAKVRSLNDNGVFALFK